MILTTTIYQALTGDTVTAATAVATAASAAQDLLEDTLGRRGALELGDRTEACDIAPDGTLYPRAVPVVSVDGGLVVQHDVVFGGTPDVGVFVGLIGSLAPLQATITYRGGYSSTSAPAYMMRDLAFVAHALIHRNIADDPPAGATSLRVGDVAVTYEADGTGPPAVAGVSWSSQTMRHRDRS